jgi:magnesium transporter
MIITREYREKSWIDLTSPTQEEVDSLIFLHNIDPNITKDLLSPTPKQHLKHGGSAVYAVIHIPILRKKNGDKAEQEIDFIVTKNKLITARYDSVDALHYFAKKFEADEILGREESEHPFFGSLREIYKFLFDELSFMDGWLKEIEKNIFAGQEKDMVFAISNASRNLLTFKRTLLEHRNIWVGLAGINEDDFDQDFHTKTEEISEEWQRLMFEINNLSEMIVELRETNNSILSTKQNEVMKVLTIMAFVTFPLSLIATIFGMNTVNIPLIGSNNDFWKVMSIMLTSTLFMFIFFRYKKWI